MKEFSGVMSEVETSSSRLRRGAKVKISVAKRLQLFSSHTECSTTAHFFSVMKLIGFIQERNSYSGGAAIARPRYHISRLLILVRPKFGICYISMVLLGGQYFVQL